MLSVCLHVTVVGVGLAVHASPRQRPERPEFGIEPAVDSAPVSAPKAAEDLPVQIEPPAPANELLAEPPLPPPVEPVDVPAPGNDLGAPVAAPAVRAGPQLERIVAAPEPNTPPADDTPVDVAVAEPDRPASAFVEARPLAERNRPPEYPATERVLGHEGTVRIAVELDEFGDVIDARLHEGCPFPALNRAALLAVRVWRFQPAMRAGNPVRDSLVVPVVFTLR